MHWMHTEEDRERETHTKDDAQQSQMTLLFTSIGIIKQEIGAVCSTCASLLQEIGSVCHFIVHSLLPEEMVGPNWILIYSGASLVCFLGYFWCKAFLSMNLLRLRQLSTMA